MAIVYGPGGFDPTKPDNNVLEVTVDPDVEPTLDERVAAVENAVDTLILDSLGGFDV